MVLSFEEEIIAFCIAIFFGFFVARVNDDLYMTPESVAEDLIKDIGRLGWVSDDDKVNFHIISPLALHHGRV